ncbi:hypothetical protein BRARA_I04598 [Brassica rapa]|uniref:Serine-threonine/tyrosine-protein kinase catalytic domain-containing protein n=1 Tax=Brassica campestris TaxID=3711 RepID=A0A397Y376_BRACM|nr:hypothetical protein BRARA_I04598 [Brassica rapa]
MSLEYVMHGHFSIKSDVYSFEVLVLEIISGKKNINFYEENGAHVVTYYLSDPDIIGNIRRNWKKIRSVPVRIVLILPDHNRKYVLTRITRII